MYTKLALLSWTQPHDDQLTSRLTTFSIPPHRWRPSIISSFLSSCWLCTSGSGRTLSERWVLGGAARWDSRWHTSCSLEDTVHAWRQYVPQLPRSKSGCFRVATRWQLVAKNPTLSEIAHRFFFQGRSWQLNRTACPVRPLDSLETALMLINS